MQHFKCHLPQTCFGEGKLSDLGSLSRKYGAKAMLAIDPYLEQTGLADRITSILSKESISVVVWGDIQPNPSCFGVDEAGRLAIEEECEFVIAAGGGSAMDFGKAISVVAKNPGNAWDFTERSDHEVRRPASTLPIVAIPTTAGTGSEATPFAVLNNTDLKEKSTIANDAIFPDLSIVDPELMLSMPSSLTASTGFDALAHAIESRISVHANPFTKMTALEAIRIIGQNLRNAVNDGNNRDARSSMAWAAGLGGAAIAHIGVALPHALAQPVGGYKGAPHGLSIAALMVEILRMSYQSDLQAFAEITEALEPETANLSTAKKAERCAECVQTIMNDIGLRVRLSDFGMVESDIDKVTNIAFTGYYFDIKCHPLKVNESDVKEIYRTCL